MELEKEIKSSAGLIVDLRNRMLLQRKDESYIFWPNYWSVFGGEINEGESELDGFLRELREEGDLIVSNPKLFQIKGFVDTAKIDPRKNKLKRYGKIYFFAARFDGNLRKIRNSEGAGFSIFTEEEIEKYGSLGLIVPHVYSVINKFYSDIKKGVFKF